MTRISSVTKNLFGGTDSEYADHGLLVRILLTIRSSVLLFTIFLGFVMILSGVVIEFTLAHQGVLAAMLMIWGFSAIIFGILGFGLLIVLGLR